MNRALPYVIATALLFGTSALLANGVRAAQSGQNEAAQMATDGAFRDGLFIGRLAAARGQAAHPLVGRWSSDRDRASFAAGYERGYREFRGRGGGQRVPLAAGCGERRDASLRSA